MTAGSESLEVPAERFWREELSRRHGHPVRPSRRARRARRRPAAGRAADADADDSEGADAPVKIPVVVYSLAIRGATSPDRRGLLQPLLRRWQVGCCGDDVFGLPAVQAVIDWKWSRYARRVLIWQLIAYVCWVVSFFAFTVLFQDEGNERTLVALLRTARGKATVSLDLLSLLCMMPFVAIEVASFAAYGFKGWASAWNALDMTTYALQIVISTLHLSRASVDRGSNAPASAPLPSLASALFGAGPGADPLPTLAQRYTLVADKAAGAAAAGMAAATAAAQAAAGVAATAATAEGSPGVSPGGSFFSSPSVGLFGASSANLTSSSLFLAAAHAAPFRSPAGSLPSTLLASPLPFSASGAPPPSSQTPLFLSLSVCCAAQCILLLFRLQYFSRVFRATRFAFVDDLVAVVKDVKTYLAFLAMVVFGWAAAFHILFRAASDQSTHPEFATIGMSCLTMLNWVAGNIDMTPLSDCANPTAAIALGVGFTLVVATVLMNLLVGILCNSLQRVTDEEGKRALVSKAQAIDEIDAVIPERLERALAKRGWYPPYLQILRVDPDRLDAVDLEGVWGIKDTAAQAQRAAHEDEEEEEEENPEADEARGAKPQPKRPDAPPARADPSLAAPSPAAAAALEERVKALSDQIERLTALLAEKK